jgi:nitrogen fixation/metabolism regulation signal transduction histidine kinase
MRFRLRIILVLILAAMLPLLAVFVSLTVYLNHQRESLVNMKLNTVYSGAVSSYENMGKSILSQMEQVADDQALVRYLLVKDQMGFIDQQGLIDYAVSMKRLLDLDYIAVVSPEGVALARGHDPNVFGDTLSNDPVFAEALGGQKVRSLDQIRYGNDNVLIVMALTPIWYENRQLIGIVAGGRLLDESFCRNLQAISGAEVLLVQGNVLLARTIAGQSDEMALYLQNKQTFRTKIQGLWYTFSRYPLEDFSGNKVADLLMGVSTHDLDIIFENMRTLYGGFALGGLILAIVLGFISSRGFRRPIENLTEAAARLADGDFTARVNYGGRGELASLVDTFNEMAADLEDYRRKLVESERLAAFTTMARKVAHEIKNPLTPIKIAIQDLRRAYEASDPNFAEAFEQSTRTVLSEVESLSRIVDEFSEFAKFPAPRLVRENLNDIVRSTALLFSKETQVGALRMELTSRATAISADKDQIKRVIVNLVKNGLEAIPPSGRVTIRTALLDNRVILTVTDTGPGLSAAAKQNLFTPYFTTKQGGSGLGLVIVKKIISEHDGRIKIDDSIEGGTAAIMELPLFRE